MTTLYDHTTPLDPSRTDLAREFKRQPYGIHSPELQVLLNRMRSMPRDGKHLLYVTKPGEEWVLAQTYGDPLKIRLLREHVFSSAEEGEWFVFKLRWKMLCGVTLTEEEPGA